MYLLEFGESMSPLKNEYWDKDKKVCILIRQHVLDQLIKICKDSDVLETGGILIGKYSKDLGCAIISEITNAPKDSKRGRTTFERGVAGLKSILQKALRLNRHYYLGEWHYHPYGSANPSTTDKRQVKEISEDEKYNCPEPILVIIGGDPNQTLEIGVFVQIKKFIQLT